MIVCISLKVFAIDDLIGFNDSLMGWTHVHSFNWGSIQVDSIVHNKQWIIVIHDIIINTDSI